MSERKGGPHKKKRKPVQIDEDSHSLLTRYCQSKKISMSLVLGEFIEKGVRHDIFEEGWIKKLQLFDQTVESYARESECPAYAFGETRKGNPLYRCVWYREGSPPSIRVLGETETLQGSACRSCNRTGALIKGLEERDEKISSLEEELYRSSTQVFKAPVCNGGAMLNGDGTQFRGCRRSPRAPVSVLNYCKILMNGLPCALYSEAVIGVGEKDS